MRKLQHAFRNAAHKAAHHPTFKHGHHAVYLVYYGLALLDDTGLRFYVVGGIFLFHLVFTVTGE